MAGIIAQAQQLFNEVQKTIVTGDETMFVMDTLYVPQQVNQIVLAQANTTSAPAVITPQFDKAFTGCQDVGNVKFYAKSAFNSMPLLPVVLEHLGYRWVGNSYNVPEEIRATIKSGVYDAPKHGVMKLIDAAHHVYAYEATLGYVGKDTVVFWVEVSGKRFKIVQNLAVVDSINDRGQPLCNSMKFSLQTDFMGQGWKVTGPISLNLANMSSGVLGMTVGTSITLDDNAAGTGWFIDSTPGDNSEFLPTSNPYEWVAKEGSAAYGKMDMLSVLLHGSSGSGLTFYIQKCQM